MTRTITTEIIIGRFRKTHGPRFGYDKVVYRSAKDKVLIYCFASDDKYGAHEYFLQTPDNHAKGKTCPKCSGHYRMNTKEFIEMSRHIHENKYEYDWVDYINTYTDVMITCRIHGNFPQRPSSHLSGAGCKKCSDQMNHENQRKSREQFISEVYAIYGNSIDCSNAIYINNHTDLEIHCTIHDLTFTKNPCVLLAGHGCSECSGKYYKLTTELFIRKSKDLHGDEYDYSNTIYAKSNENVIIYCKKHKISFQQTPNSHLSGSGCPRCAIERTNNSKFSNTDEFIQRSSIIHNNKYTYDFVTYTGCQTKVIIICPFHGEFEQTPSNHLRGQGCPDCRLEYIGKSNLSDTNSFIEKSKILFADSYDYSLTVYVNQTEKVKLICKKHNYMFEQTPKGHFRKHNGCKICSKSGYSKKAIYYLDFISSFHNRQIQHAEFGGEYKIPNTNMFADGFCKETNTIYEFHGDFWHGNLKKYDPNTINQIANKTFGELYEKTLERERHVRNMGFNLVVMWENDWNKINKCIRILQRVFRNWKRCSLGGPSFPIVGILSDRR